MPVQQALPIFIASIHGGQNDRDQPWLIEEAQSVYIQNLDIEDIGARKRRNGVLDFGMRTDNPYGIWRAEDVPLTQEVLFTIYEGKPYVVSSAGVLQERACGVSFTNTLHQAHTARYSGRIATFINSAQVADSDASLATELTVITDDNQFTQNVSMAPRCSVWWQNRMWVADNTLSLTEETLWWSELADGLSYSTFNTALIESGVGGRITALQPIRSTTAPQMLVFKERAIAVVETFWGSSSALIPVAADALDVIKSSIRLVTANAGCIATNSVQFVPGAPGGDVYFLSLDGVRAISRANDDTLSGAGVPISDPIKGTIDRINFEHADKAVSAVHDNSYYLAVPLDGDTENTHILKFDLIRQAWSVHVWKAKAMATARLRQTQDQMWLQYNTSTLDCSVTAAASGYHLFQTFSGLNDPNSTPVIYQEASRAFVMQDVNRKKRWDWVSVFFRNDASETVVMALEYNIDNSSWVTFASLVSGGDVNGGVILGTTPLPWGVRTGILRRMKFSLSDVNPGYTLQVRITGQSDLAIPVIFNIGVRADMLQETFDNEIT